MNESEQIINKPINQNIDWFQRLIQLIEQSITLTRDYSSMAIP